MNTLFRAGAALAACTTLGLLTAVVAVAEPQRTELLARQLPAGTRVTITPSPITPVRATQVPITQVAQR
jgi:hypothetical protein